MKDIIKAKAERVVEFYKKKYIENHGELFNERKQNSFATHLIFLRIFDQYVSIDKLDDAETEIVSAYFKKNNDHEFNSLLSDFMIVAGNEAFEKYGVKNQELHIYAKLRPIIRDITFKLFIQAGVSSVIEDDFLNYDNYG